MGTRTAVGAGAVLVAAALLAASFQSRGSGDLEEDHRKAALAAPTAVPKVPGLPARLDDHREHRIVLQVGYTAPDRNAPAPRGLRTVGYHCFPFAQSGSNRVECDSVRMGRLPGDPDVTRLWRSDVFGAREGDVVKTAIDARSVVPVSCIIQQDGVEVVRTRVDTRRGEDDPGKTGGVVSCMWVVQPTAVPAT